MLPFNTINKKLWREPSLRILKKRKGSVHEKKPNILDAISYRAYLPNFLTREHHTILLMQR